MLTFALTMIPCFKNYFGLIGTQEKVHYHNQQILNTKNEIRTILSGVSLPEKSARFIG